MKKILLLTIMVATMIHAQGSSDETKRAIVKIYTVFKYLNYQQPWNSSIASGTGSGSIIRLLDSNQSYILTNAHVVANQTFIEVQRYGERERYIAKVHAVSHQADLALLEVEDQRFFEGVTPLTFGELPEVEQQIVVYGYPMGGNTLSATIGVVSRIEHNVYAHSGESFLSIQVDAAVNPGNSGGPALCDGKIVGVVMQVISSSQNIGYLVPINLIRHFLEDLKDGHNDGFPELGITTQTLENPTLKAYYGLDANTTGNLVDEIVYNSPLKNVLQERDILTSIDGHKIEDDGTVEFREHEYTNFGYYVDMHQVGEKITLEVIRKGKKQSIQTNLTRIADEVLLVKTTQYDRMPSYFIVGGYIFSPVSRNLLLSTTLNRVLLSYYASQWPKPDRKEMVVLLKVLASDISRGNSDMQMWLIEKINGERYVDFAEFYRKVEAFKGKYLTLEDKDGVQVIIDMEKAKAKQTQILKQYNIEYDKSIELRENNTTQQEVVVSRLNAQ